MRTAGRQPCTQTRQKPDKSPPIGTIEGQMGLLPRGRARTAVRCTDEGLTVFRRLEAEVAPELGDVALGLDVVLRLLQRAVRGYDERRADDPLDELAVEGLLAVGAVRRLHGPVRVGQQRE